MNRRNNNIYIGVLIIAVGILALLINMHILHDLDDLFGGTLLLVGALFFLGLYSRNRAKWWPLLPGVVLGVLGIGVISEILIADASDFIGAALFYGLFVVFAFVFSRNKADWWAIIPAGACFTLGTVVLVDTTRMLDSDFTGMIFLLGLGLTFLYLWSLRNEVKNVGWSIWPAVVFIGLSLIVFVEQADWLESDIVFPLVLILVGVLVIFYGARKKK